MEQNTDILSKILDRYSYLEQRPSLDFPAVNCPPEKLVAFMKAMQKKELFDMLLDVTAIDWHEEQPRFTCVYHIYSTTTHKYLRVASNCTQQEPPEIPSLVSLWPAADWHERETFDMLGIHFIGHPDLKRILMWDDYPYYPLRKDFPLAGIEVPLPAADVVERTGACVQEAPMMGGPFFAAGSGPMSKSEPRAQDESWSEQSPKPKTSNSFEQEYSKEENTSSHG